MVKNVLEIRKKCPLCNSKKIKIIFSKNFDDIRTKNFFKTHLNNKFPFKILDYSKYNISECQQCKLLFQNSILNDEYNNKFYNDYINHDEILINKNSSKQNSLIFQSEIKLIDKIFKNKNIKILEYGAGLGAWINAIKKSGYKDICAIEISKERREYLKKNKIISFKNISNLKKKFDLIYSDQTLEHIKYPGKAIKELVKLLKPNGYLIFKVPPGNLLKNKLDDKYVAQKDEATPLEHINIYTNMSIKFVKSKYKLKNVKFFLLFKIYEKEFFKSLISYFYHLYYGKKFILQKYDD
jgi:SAM-dependent methyltransferase